MTPRKENLRKVYAPPPLIPLEQINMDLVEEARAFRCRNKPVPVGATATELVRFLRATDAFGGKNVRNYPDAPHLPSE